MARSNEINGILYRYLIQIYRKQPPLKLDSWLTLIGRHFGQGSLSDRVVVFLLRPSKCVEININVIWGSGLVLNSSTQEGIPTWRTFKYIMPPFCIFWQLISNEKISQRDVLHKSILLAGFTCIRAYTLFIFPLTALAAIVPHPPPSPSSFHLGVNLQKHEIVAGLEREPIYT